MRLLTDGGDIEGLGGGSFLITNLSCRFVWIIRLFFPFVKSGDKIFLLIYPFSCCIIGEKL